MKRTMVVRKRTDSAPSDNGKIIIFANTKSSRVGRKAAGARTTRHVADDDDDVDVVFT